MAQSQNKSKLGRIVPWPSVIMEKYRNCMRLLLLGNKKANKTENIAEVMFCWGFLFFLGGGLNTMPYMTTK